MTIIYLINHSTNKLFNEVWNYNIQITNKIQSQWFGQPPMEN
jgi:hypothetical protein